MTRDERVQAAIEHAHREVLSAMALTRFALGLSIRLYLDSEASSGAEEHLIAAHSLLIDARDLLEQALVPILPTPEEESP